VGDQQKIREGITGQREKETTRLSYRELRPVSLMQRILCKCHTMVKKKAHLLNHYNLKKKKNLRRKEGEAGDAEAIKIVDWGIG